MRLLWIYLLLHTAFYTEANFGTPYLKKSRLCRSWNCVSTKLGLPNSLPPRGEYGTILKSLLPPGPWQDVSEKVLETCYNKRQRNYVGTCPSQAMLHCTVDIMIENCPEEYWKKSDGCNPVSTLAGTTHMFTQSRYEDLESNLKKLKQPAWYMKHYYDSKCCAVPEILNTTVVKECGFTSFLHYYDHSNMTGISLNQYVKQATTTHKPTSRTTINVNNIHSTENPLPGRKDGKPGIVHIDPLYCCDMSGFLTQEMRLRNSFEPYWDRQKRLVFETGPFWAPSATTTARAPVNKDVRVVPLSCEKENCIFQKLNVVSDTGSVDTEAFLKLLDNFTASHPTWNKAKARVITQCLTRPHGYTGDCEINKILGCTLDVLSENCPYASKQDTCRHSRRNNTVCQISSSMFRPKNRRAVCGLPNLVSGEALTACGVTSVSRTEFVPEPPVVKPADWRSQLYACKDNAPITWVLMTDMGVSNQYHFMDYFKMKHKIIDFTSRHHEWALYTQFYLNTFIQTPRYNEYCTSTKKLMNILDAMLTTCPISRRNNTNECTDLFKVILQDVSKEKEDQMQQHSNHMFLPQSTPPLNTIAQSIQEWNTHHRSPMASYNYHGNSSIPVILPVYMRSKNPLNSDTSSTGNPQHGVFQSTPYLLHGKIPTTKAVQLLIPPGLP